MILAAWPVSSVDWLLKSLAQRVRLWRWGQADASAIVWAHHTVLLIEDVRAISRGDSHFVELGGAYVVPLGATLETGGPADLTIMDADPRRSSTPLTLALVRGGRSSRAVSARPRTCQVLPVTDVPNAIGAASVLRGAPKGACMVVSHTYLVAINCASQRSAMTAPRLRTPWLTLLVLTATLVAACGAPSTPGTQATNVPAATGATPDPSPPVIDVADLAGSMATAEAALRQDDRQRAGLVDLGPGALELAAAMDAAVGRALTTTRDDVAGPGTANASVRPMAAVGAVAVGPEPGFNAMVVWALLITSLDDFAKVGTKSGTVENKPETIEVAGNTGTITTTMTIKVVTTGSRLSVDVTMKAKGQVADKATGAILYAIDSIASGHVDLDFCPDPGGQAAASIKLTSSEIYTQGGGSSKGVSKEFTGSATISVDNDAEISKVEGSSEGAEKAGEGITNAAGQGDAVTSATRTASDNIANDGDGKRLPGVPRNIQFGGEGTTPDQQVKLWGSTVFFVETTLTAAANEAEKLWREGKCVEVIVDPEGGDVEANSSTQVTATVRHIFEGNELDKPVEATLTGVTAIEPAGEKQPAPATITYTAGPNQGDYGRINFKSTSNRGIGEKTVIFTVRSGWTTTNDDSPILPVSGTKCGGIGGEWTISGDQQLDAGFFWEALTTVTIEESTLSGSYHTHTINTGLGLVTTGDQRGNARVVLNPDGSVTMTLDQAPLTVTNTGLVSSTTTIPGVAGEFLWQPDAGDACP